MLVFADESGFDLLPGLVRTYAPEAHTPVIKEKQTRDHLSVLGGMPPAGQVDTLVRRKPLTGLHCLEFCKHLRAVTGRPILVIWDGSPIHRRVAVKEFVEQSKGKVVEQLPGYAPDLNPWDEGGWHHLKNVEMRDLATHDREEHHEQCHLALERLRQKPNRVRSFFAQAGLSLKKTGPPLRSDQETGRPVGGTTMPTFITTISFTDKGIKEARDTCQRATAFRAEADRAGVKVVGLYWTIGPFDGVLILEAADAETVTALLLRMAALGNVRTQTCRALTAAEMEKVVARLT